MIAQAVARETPRDWTDGLSIKRLALALAIHGAAAAGARDESVFSGGGAVTSCRLM